MQNLKFFLAMLMIGSCAYVRADDSFVTEVNWQRPLQRIDGFGASSAWYDRRVGSFSDEHLQRFVELAFDPENGIGLSIHRLRINTTRYDVEQAAFDWDHEDMRSVIRYLKATAPYEPVTLSSPWTPPAPMKSTGKRKGGGHLLDEYYDAYARCLVQWMEGISARGNISADILSIQNEPGKKPWEACEWTTDHYVRFTRDHLLPALQKSELDIKLCTAESTAWKDRWIVPLYNDPVTRKAVDIAGAHRYGGRPRTFTVVEKWGIPLWMTEHFYEGKASSDLAYGLINARQVHENLTIADCNAYLFWWLMSIQGKKEHRALILLTDDPDEPFVVTKKFWVFGHFSRFVRPGFRLLQATTQPGDTSFCVTAFRDPDTGTSVLVLNNLATKKRSWSLDLEGSDISTWSAWRTDSERDMARLEGMESAGQALTLTIPGESITTLVGTPGKKATP